MSNSWIDLDRRFIPCSAELLDVDVLSGMGPYGGALDWDALLQRRRVVLLAEAGSGKTTEFEQQESRLQADGKRCFLTTLRKIGRNGFQGALQSRYRDQFQKWRASGEPAWLFLDSFDEAKRADYRMAEVLDEVASAIHGVEGRIHIVLSGRYSDWEFKRDLRNLLDCIPLSPPNQPTGMQTPNDALVAALDDKKPQSQPEAESPLTVVMGSLDKERVGKFAVAKGVTQVEKFLVQLDQKNLWRLARRPIDLDWLVKHWCREDSFGNWEAMLHTSIREYLAEPNPDLSRTDCLDPERNMSALERIGAALVLGRFETIRIPEGEADLAEEVDALDLAEILPDWKPNELRLLFARPIFQAAAAGYVKLTNDNEGEVRGFLAARWLFRLCSLHGCPWSRLQSLLFADTYGEALVRPSMWSTAAWLSLWNLDVSKEVLQRDPLLLMGAGDPGSLSLATRVQVLEAVLERLSGEDSDYLPDRNALMRISREDMAPSVRQYWEHNERNAASGAVRELLLLMIWLGRLPDCAELALRATLDGRLDPNLVLYVGRAVAVAGNDDHKRRYIDHILQHMAGVRPSDIWDALDTFFPDHLTVEDFLSCIEYLHSSSREERSSFDYHGSRLMLRVQSRNDVLRILQKLLSLLSGSNPFPDLGTVDEDQALFGTVELAAVRLLTLSPVKETPLEAIDVALRLGYFRRIGKLGFNARKKGQELWSLLWASPDRRRTTLWHSVARLRKAQPGKVFRIPRQIRVFGYDVVFTVEDVPWLLSDIATKPAPLDVEFAVHAAMEVWVQNSKDPDLLTRIKEAASTSPDGLRVIDGWLNPPEPSAEEQLLEREHLQYEERHALSIAERDQSWIELADNLRADPNQLKKDLQRTADGANTPLYCLWWLLDQCSQSLSRRAIRDLSPLHPMFGDDVVRALQTAFIDYWRVRQPVSIGKRALENRRTVYQQDLIGVVGVTQEAESDAAWAAKLSPHEAELATTYATFEINGLPPWLDDLATSHPHVVGNVLWDYLQPDLFASEPEPSLLALYHLDYANAVSIATFEERLVNWLMSNAEAPLRVVELVLGILSRSPSARRDVAKLARDYFSASSDQNAQAAYFAVLCSESPDEAVSMLEETLAEMGDKCRQRGLVQACLAASYGSRHSRSVFDSSSLCPDTLRRLAILAFSKVHPDDDNNRPSGVGYTRDQRDQAERARYTLFKAFADTPGLATYQVLRELRQEGDFPMAAEQIRHFERRRVEQDSELERWRPESVREFEKNFESLPATSQGLQHVGLVALGEIGHHLLDGDFNQGSVVVELRDEIAVQNWFANELANRQGQSYTLERGPIVADEKEPDIRLSSRITDARCPIEMKIAENWSLRELESALQDQLAGRYLRVRDNRFGILLLVHQKARARGWKCGKRYLSFSGVVAHLRKLATEIGASGSLAGQTAVCAVDLSGIQFTL